MIKIKKIRALKPAPAWKRLLAYAVDAAFLFIILVLFITGLYGGELALLFNNIYGKGAEAMIQDSHIIPNIDITGMNPSEQNAAYWLYMVQSRYSQSIFVLNQLISGLYFGIFWWSTGQTIGARLLKIKVVSPLSSHLPVPAVIIRVLSLKLVELAWGLPLLIVTNPILKQRVHDSLSNTVVVEDIKADKEESKSIEDEEEELEEN